MSAAIESPPPIVIPPKLKHDRAIRRLLVAWVNAHARYFVCEKRVNWKTPQSRRIEKARRREKWTCVARILTIEHTLLKWLATATRHPDLWMPSRSGRLSRRTELRNRYYAQRALERSYREKHRRDIIDRRETIVAQIRLLERNWMCALLASVHPQLHAPNALPLHPRELLPRKVARASKVLVAEVTTPAARPPLRITTIVYREQRSA